MERFPRALKTGREEIGVLYFHGQVADMHTGPLGVSSQVCHCHLGYVVFPAFDCDIVHAKVQGLVLVIGVLDALLLDVTAMKIDEYTHSTAYRYASCC